MNRIRLALILALCLLSTTICFAGAADEQQVTFQGAGDITLSGTLQLPAGDGTFPAVVLLAGSGPTDRDGNQPPTIHTDLLKQIAQSLSQSGIASLRFDKRGMYANAGGLPKDASEYGEFFSWENLVEDSASAVRFLRKQPRIDPKHVGIIGHSEGGLLALEAARVLGAENQPPSALILLSTPGRKVDVIIAEQLKALLARQAADAERTDFLLSENTRIIHAISETGQVPPDVPAGLAALYPNYLGEFLKGEFAVDPCKLAENFPGPVLVIAGAADTQVSPERDAKALDAALTARKTDDHKLAIIPQSSHNLKVLSKPDDPGFDGPIAPDALKQLQEWAGAHLR